MNRGLRRLSKPNERRGPHGEDGPSGERSNPCTTATPKETGRFAEEGAPNLSINWRDVSPFCHATATLTRLGQTRIFEKA